MCSVAPCLEFDLVECSFDDRLGMRLWALRLRDLPSLSPSVLKGMIVEARQPSRIADRAHNSSVAARVRAWATDAVLGNYKAAHAYLRKADTGSVPAPAEDGQRPGLSSFDPDVACQARCDQWALLWQRDRNEVVPLSNSLAGLKSMAKWQQHKLQPIDDWEVQGAIDKLRNSKGLGCDHWPPQELKALPPNAIAALPCLYRECETLVAIPAQVMLNIMRLLPKPSGGERAIVLQALWHVVWSSTRAPHVRAFDIARAQHCDSAVRGASAQGSGLLRRLLDELAVLSGQKSAGVHYDVEKFYDSLDVAQLVKFSTYLGFPVLVAAMDLQIHVAARALRWCSHHSLPMDVSSSILAGSKYSNSYARAYLYDMLDGLHMAAPVTQSQHVDDLATLAHGDATSVLEMLVEAATCLRDGFASRQLVVSTKTVVTASTHQLADSICGSLHALGIPCKAARAAKDLGLDSASGRHRFTKVIQARLAKARVRLGKLAGVRRIDKRAKVPYKTDIWPVSSYGFAAMGVSTSAPKQLRTNAAAAASLKTGGCATSTIAFNYPFGSDPATKARLAVLQHWLGLWTSSPPDRKAPTISAMWPRQLALLSAVQLARRWAMVRGPLRATIVVLLEFGWRPVAPSTWGEPLPADRIWRLDGKGNWALFCRSLANSAMARHWPDAAKHWNGTSLERGGDFTSLKAHLRHFEKKGLHGQYGALHTVAIGATWPRARKFSALLPGVLDDTCPRCGRAPDTDIHRYCQCPANRDIPDRAVQNTQHLAERACAEHELECYVLAQEHCPCFARSHPRASR